MILDAVIATYNRADAVVDAVESILRYEPDLNMLFVVDNASTDNTLDRLARYKDNPKVTVISSPKNLGAPGGKNIGLKRSQADVILVIDDDAVLFTPEPLKRVKEIFAADPKLGIIQCKIVNFALKKILRYEFPGPDPEKMGDVEFDTGFFVGAGHGIRKTVLEEVGYYPDEFFYAHEEVDLSYRAAEAGWKIRYCPSVGVYHKKDSRGRITNRQLVHLTYKNRLVMSYRYLPLIYRIVSGTLWGIKAFLWSRDPTVPLAAFAEYRKLRPAITRAPLSAETVRYLRRNYGRIWY